jgi:hypothetical protein
MTVSDLLTSSIDLGLLEQVWHTGETDLIPSLDNEIAKILAERAEAEALRQAELAEEQRYANNPNLLHPATVEQLVKEVNVAQQACAQACQLLRRCLEMEDMNAPMLSLQRNQDALAPLLQQIAVLGNYLNSLTQDYQALLNEDNGDAPTTVFLRQGVHYCVHYLSEWASYDALIEEFQAALFPHRRLERIYSYLDLLPNLYQTLGQRLQKAWQQHSG